jgi:cytochrome P450
MNTTTSAIPSLHGLLGSPTEYNVWVLAAALIVPLSSFLLLRTTTDGKITDLGGIPIATAWTFFSKRYDFVQANLRRTGGLPFRFRVLQHRVVTVSGEKARRGFFNDPSLDFIEGYKILMGGAPQMDDIEVGRDQVANVSDFVRRLNLLMKKERITDTLPVFLEDINKRMLGWGKEGQINPFKEVYDLVFQMTIRMSTCHDLARDLPAMERLGKHYWTLEKSATPTALLLPWFPSPSSKTKKQATTDVYLFILKYVQDQRKAGADTNDPIDILIRNGDTDNDIVATVLGIIFAGVVNTGVNSCWALLHLGTNPTWRNRAIDEIKSVIAKHTSSVPATEPFHKKLAAIPLEAWENEFPSLDLITRETIRLTVCGVALRRNLGKDIQVQDAHIKKGDFIAYCLGDTHMNPEIYSNPTKFDPGRFEEGMEEDKKGYFSYLGWGVGRHPCAGMKFAKLEIKLILSMLLLGYEYKLVDDRGAPTATLPQPDRNDIQQARPIGKTVYMDFKRVQA